MAKDDRSKDYHDFIDFFDPMIEAFIEGVDDIRHKFEEVFYGREVTGDIAEPGLGREREMDVLVEFYGWPGGDLPDALADSLGLDNARRDYEKRQIGREELDRGMDMDR